MKKYILMFSISVCVLFFTSCSLLNGLLDNIDAGYYISIKNCTSEKITVTLEEDPESNVSKKYGAENGTFIINAGCTVKTELVNNDYYRITCGDSVLHPYKYDNESGVYVIDDSVYEYFLINPYRTVNIIEENNVLCYEEIYYEND